VSTYWKIRTLFPDIQRLWRSWKLLGYEKVDSEQT